MNLCNAAKTKAPCGKSVKTLNDLITPKQTSACRDARQDQWERATQSALFAISAVDHPSLIVDSTVLATDQLTRDAAVDARGGSAMPGSARGAQRRLPEADPNVPSRAEAFASDPSLVVPVIASLEEVLLARKLRQQLRRRYLDRGSQPCSLWCVGID
jgi:hypothetical protein